MYRDCTRNLSCPHIVWDFWGNLPQSYSRIKRSYSLRFVIICIAFFQSLKCLPWIPLLTRSPKQQQTKNTKTPQDIKATGTIATNTMPTNEEINKARLRGAIARDVADQQLLDPHQRAQNQADAALPLPREKNTAAMGRHFSDTFPGDGQPQAAIQTAPPINSRTGQQPSIATNEQPRRVITTDAHARIIAPPRQR